MVSTINENYPVAGVDQTSQGFRDNFAAAKNEIEALQGQVITVINDITDVNTISTTPVENDVLKFIGGEWVPASINVTIDDLTDVDTTTITPATSDVLIFDGTNWVPQSMEIQLDVAPKLGGMLDVSTFGLGDGTANAITFDIDNTATNYFNVIIDTFPTVTLEALGTDDDIDITLRPKGDGVLKLGNGVQSRFVIKASNNTAGDGAQFDIRGADSSFSGGAGGDLCLRPGAGFDGGPDGIVRLCGYKGVTVAKVLSVGLTGVNHLVFANNSAGLTPSLSTAGNDTDVSLDILAKGSGTVNINSPAIVGSITSTEATASIPDMGEFLLVNLPDATLNANRYALVTDAVGGRTIVRSDGTDWKIVSVEGATVS